MVHPPWLGGATRGGAGAWGQRATPTRRPPVVGARGRGGAPRRGQRGPPHRRQRAPRAGVRQRALDQIGDAVGEVTAPARQSLQRRVLADTERGRHLLHRSIVLVVEDEHLAVTL